MLTDRQKQVIDARFPGGDRRANMRRRCVLALACYDGELTAKNLADVAGVPRPLGVAGLFTSGHSVLVKDGRARLAPWLLAELGLAATPCPEPEAPTLPPDEPPDDDAEEGDSDRYVTDPLADVREALAGCKNVAASVADSVSHLSRKGVRFPAAVLGEVDDPPIVVRVAE